MEMIIAVVNAIKGGVVKKVNNKLDLYYLIS